MAPRGNPRLRCLVALPLLVLPLLLSACTVRLGGSSSVEAENDRLRALARDNAATITSLEARNAELSAKIAELAQARALDAEVLDALPRIASIELDRLSGPRRDRVTPPTPTPAQGEPLAFSRAILYLRPLDGKGRFTQAVGSLAAEALWLADPIPPAPPTPESVANPAAPATPEPIRLALRELSPIELRDAYRSGLAGTHYAIDLAFASPVRVPGTLILRARYVDALTGQTHEALLNRRVELNDPRLTRPGTADARRTTPRNAAPSAPSGSPSTAPPPAP